MQVIPPCSVQSYHQVIHPLKIWRKYNFWQKVYFDRQLKHTQSGMDGKFDCYRRNKLIEIGLFDNKNFLNDADLQIIKLALSC